MTPGSLIVAVLRLTALSLGSLIVAASFPLALLGGAAPGDSAPTISPLIVIPACGCVLAAGFLYFGICAHSLAGSARRRILAGVLLAVPAAAGLALLLTPARQGMHAFGVLLCIPALALIGACVWPAGRKSLRR